MNKKRAIIIAIIILVSFMITGVASVFGINSYVKSVGKSKIITLEEAAKLTDVDCIIVLGCLVESDGTPSVRLGDRIQRGIELYKAGAAPKILMSGDHGREDYDEVGAMKRVAVEAGVPSSDVFMDHAGFSTYESIYRVKEIFGADKIIVVTQEYHLYRALYIAEGLDVEAYGVNSDFNTYPGQFKRDVREILARCKDVFTTALKVKPNYLGEKISIHGDGDITNDR